GEQVPVAFPNSGITVYFLTIGFSSVVLTLVVWVWSRVTSLAVPPISMVSVPVSFMVMSELLTRPLVVSKRIVPLESLLFKSAFMILKGKAPPPAFGPGGWYLR